MCGHMALDITVTRRTVARAGCITWRYHALVRAQEGSIARAQAIRVLTEGKSSSNARGPNLFPNVCSCASRKTTNPCTSRWATMHQMTVSMSLPSIGSTRASGKTHSKDGEEDHDNQSKQSTLCCLWWRAASHHHHP